MYIVGSAANNILQHEFAPSLSKITKSILLCERKRIHMHQVNERKEQMNKTSLFYVAANRWTKHKNISILCLSALWASNKDNYSHSKALQEE